MKQKTLLNLWFLLCLMLFGGGSSAWATDPDYTFTLSDGDFTSSSHQKTSGALTWTHSHTSGTETYGWDDSFGFKFGSGNKSYPTAFKLTSSSVSNKIKKVVVTASVNSNKSCKLDVKVGSTTYGSQATINTKNNDTWEFEIADASTVNGAVELTFSSNTGPLYLSQIDIYYSAAPSTLSVTYDGNGSTSGSVPEDDKEYDEDDEVTVLGNTGGLAKAGYAFGGWNTENDGTGTTYDADDTFTITSSTTLYAKWNAYSITAVSNNNSYGTVAGTTTITATPTEGYRVVSGESGYTVSSGSATVVNNGDNTFTVTPSSDCTVQINFEAIPTHEMTITTPTGGTLTVKNGDDVVSSGSSVREGTTLTIIPAADSSHKFAKWTATVGNTSTNYTDVFTYTVPANDFTLSATFDEAVKYAVNWSVNGNIASTEYYEEDEDIMFPDDPDDINGFTFVGWSTGTITGTTDDENDFTLVTTTPTMGTSDITYYAIFAETVPAVVDEVTDELTPTGISNPSSYGNWSGKTATSSAVYAGNSTGGTTRFQMRDNTNSGMVSTTSGGKITKVSVKWEVGTADNRTLNIFASNTAYTASSDLYDNSKTGTLVGTIVYGTSTELEIDGNYSYVGLRSKSGALYLENVKFTWDKGTPAGYENYCTSVPELPKPVITVSDVEMTWGDTNKSIAASATIADEDYDGSFIYECDDDNLTIESDGSLSCDVPGEYEVTVSIAATAENRAASETITVTVNKKNVLLTFEDPVVVEMVSTGEYSQTLAISPAAYDGDVEYEITSSTSTGALIDDATGELAFDKTGIIVVTATAPATDYYNGNTASYTLYVKTTPTITVSNQTLAYGATYTPTITGGTASITTVPANMATIDDGVITAAVVGTSTVTITTAANDTYVAGEKSFTLTVTAPTPLAATPASDPVSVFYESFDTNNGTGANDGEWSGSIASATISYDNIGWTASSEKGAYQCAKFGTGSAGGSATTPALSLSSDVVYTLTFKAGAWNSDKEGTSLSISGTNATIRNEANTADVSSVTLTKGAWNEYTLKIINGSSNAKIQFSTSGSNKRFFLDEVQLTRPGDPIESVAVTIPSSGLGTYCSLYPLDFSDTGTNDNNFKAYVVTGIDGNNITLQKLTTEVKGGVPFIIVGEGSSQVEIPTADNCSYVPSNELVGTLAPTYVTGTTAGYTNYGMSGGKFKKINTGIVPANRAYLPIADAEAREFNLVFLDDEVTGIRTIDNGKMAMDKNAVYDLSGRRVQNPKHGLYIVNGKKVIIK